MCRRILDGVSLVQDSLKRCPHSIDDWAVTSVNKYVFHDNCHILFCSLWPLLIRSVICLQFIPAKEGIIFIFLNNMSLVLFGMLH